MERLRNAGVTVVAADASLAGLLKGIPRR